MAVPETARSRSKRSGGGKAAVAMAGVLLAGAALAQQAPPALPTGAQVVSGQAAITSAGSAMTVQQSTGKAAINWTSFSIGAGASVNFVQPSASAITLNRVVGTEKSVIDGALNANGQVFLLNANGVLFNRGASVNTGGLVASTLGLSDADFNAGNFRFTNGGKAGSVVNLGSIKAADGGYVALLGPQVSNQGLVTARLGTVALAGGDKVSLNFNGSSLVSLAVDQAALDALVENGQALHADGGQVILTAKAVDALLAKVVNNTGEIRAQTVENRAGRIFLLGGTEGGSVAVGGTLDASAPKGGDGGFIETSGAHVKVDGAKITTAAPQGSTGNWLVDPNDYVIAASGGDITGAALSAALDTTNVTIQTATQGTAGGNGDIFVNDAVTKNGAAVTTLTLQAERNIEVNQPVKSAGGRLNMVFTADANGDNSGNVSFGANGSAVTAGGNFTAGATSDYQAELKGQDFTMAAGSYIDVGMGNLDVDMAGTATLAAGSLRATDSTGWPRSWYNNGQANYYSNNRIKVMAGAIVSSNLDPAQADIVASTDIQLEAGAIGTAANPIKVSGPDALAQSMYAFPNYARTMWLTNTSGDSYVNEIGVQALGTVSVSVGSQPNSIQQVQLMGDAGANGATGHGHITVRTDGAGVVQLASGDIDTSGAPGTDTGDYATSTATTIFPTSVALFAPDITVGDNAVQTGGLAPYFYYPSMPQWGMSSYAASFSGNATHAFTGSAVNGVADISAQTVWLSGPTLGLPGQEIELGGGSMLNVDNRGGSTSLKVLDGFSNVNLYTWTGAGSDSIVFNDGDHINYSTDAAGLKVAAISNDPLELSGIDTHLGNRSVSLNAYDGTIALGTNSVNLGGGAFGATINSGNGARDDGKAIYALNPKDGQAEVTAGNVAFNVYDYRAGDISGIEIAKGGSASANTLTLNSYAGNVDLVELTENHFTTLNLALNGANTAQSVAIDLAGPDDLRFSDDGSLLTLGADGVSLASGNRNFYLQAPSRTVQIDGYNGGSGYYNVYAGSGLRLNGDLLTNGGNINLTAYGSGIALTKSVRIDSNADDAANSASTGAAGSIVLSGALSSTTPGGKLAIDASSSDASGSYIQLYSSASNGAGNYLAGLSLAATGLNANYDGYIYLMGSSYRLNGDFASYGNTNFQVAANIDTEQGNLGNAGSITFGGRSLSTYYWGANVFDASTTAQGASGGNIDLDGGMAPISLYGTALKALATGGAGGTAGNINLPGVSTVQGGSDGAQLYQGGIITLNGNLVTNKADVTLAGDTRLAQSVVISTWADYGAASGTAGAVSIDSVSATAPGKGLIISTSTDTGSGYNGDGDFNQSAGAVSLKAGNVGGAWLDSLNVNTTANGAHNGGSAGAINLGGVATEGSQYYSGGAATVSGDLVTNGGDIDMHAASGLQLAADAVSIRTGGASGAGSVTLPAVDGAGDLVIDASAGNGGVAGVATLGSIGADTVLHSLDVKAGGVTLGGSVHAAGNVTIASLDAGRDLALDNAITSDSGNIVLATGRGFINNVGANALSGSSWQVWSNDPANDVRNGLAWDFKQYGAHYGQSEVLGAGNGLFYSTAPVITVSLAGNTSKVYDGSTAVTGGEISLQQSGAIDGDSVTLTDIISAAYADANAGSAKTVTASGIALASSSSGGKAVYGYSLASSSASGAIGTITPKALTLTGVSAVDRAYDGTTSVALAGGTLSGLVGDETLGVTGLSGVMADKNAGTGKAVSLGGATLADGTGLASNYTVEAPASLTVDIARRTLDVQAQAAGKVYDGSTAATVSLSDNRLEGDHLVLTSAGANFADKNAGKGKTVTVNGIAVGGEDAANYSFGTTATTTADITPRALTVGATAANKVYDGTTAASVALSDDRVAGDQLSLGAAKASFTDKNAAAGKTVNVSGISVTGADAANYTFNTTATGSAAITPRQLTVTASAGDKLYDGTSKATVALHDDRLAGDVLKVSGAGSFSDANIGNGKAVGVTGIALTGADAGNYTANANAAATASIKEDPILAKTVTTIVNYNSITPSNAAPAVHPEPAIAAAGIAVTPAMPAAVDAGFDAGSRVLVVMSPSAGGHSEAISEQGMQQVAQASAGSQAVRVPLSRNSIAKVVNGGVRLPEGVTQEFFITPSK